jgi:hypothetical protein
VRQDSPVEAAAESAARPPSWHGPGFIKSVIILFNAGNQPTLLKPSMASRPLVSNRRSTKIPAAPAAISKASLWLYENHESLANVRSSLVTAYLVGLPFFS